MRRFLPVVAIAALGLAACEQTPTEPSADGPAVAPVSTVSTLDNTLTGEPQGVIDEVTPSTNEMNEAKTPDQWAHVIYLDAAVGEVTLDFISERGFASCFEYRSDDAGPDAPANFNPAVTDGLWPFTCQNNTSLALTLTADEYVDVRMVFGAEEDERFDWTRFYVLTPPNKDECKNGDWEALGFKNQGQCVRWVETGKDSRD